MSFTIEPYNPALHGGILENLRQRLRAGIYFALIGAACLILAFVLWFVFMRNDPPGILWIAFWVSIVAGAIFVIIGAVNIAEWSSFNSSVKALKKSGLVTRGTIQRVRHRWIMLGRSFRTGDSWYSKVLDTGWVFSIKYSFIDDKGRTRTVTGTVPDFVGPRSQKHENKQVMVDPNAPRIGQNVDVIFLPDQAAILRVINTVNVQS